MSKHLTVGVTGAAGFIGSCISRQLVKKGFNVIAIDNLSKGSKKRINGIKGNFKFIKVDLLDAKKTMQALRGVNVIVHLAAFKIPRYGDRIDTLLVNTKTTENILNTAVKNNSKIIFSSTSDVYGKKEDFPFKEDGNLILGSPEVARWAYAVSKIYDEHLIYAYNEKYKVPFVILRYFGVYGPGQHMDWWGGPQALFIEKVLKGETIDIHGSGKQTRSFVFIDDVVEATIAAIDSKKALGKTINIGTKEEISILDFAKKTASLANKKLKVKKITYKSFTGKKYEDILRKVPSLVNAKLFLNWTPKTSLDEGLKKTIDWTQTQI